VTESKRIGTDLEKYVYSLGIELYGVASTTAYGRQFGQKPQPDRFVRNAQSVVIIGLPYEPGTLATALDPELAGLRVRAAEQMGVDGAQPKGAENWYLVEERTMIYHELTVAAYKVSKYLRQGGFSSVYFPPAKHDDRFRTAPFYHMPAMYLAGLGTLGLNCCILTPKFGPAVLVTSIITDCPLPAGQPMDGELCTKCRLCVKNCPIHAIDGKGWKNPFACASYGCCRVCIAICPVGRR